MTAYEYIIEIVDELLTYRYLQNNYGIHGWELIGIAENKVDGRYWYHFKRSS